MCRLCRNFISFLKDVYKVFTTPMDFPTFLTKEDMEDIERTLQTNSIKPKNKPGKIVYLPQFKKEGNDEDKN